MCSTPRTFKERAKNVDAPSSMTASLKVASRQIWEDSCKNCKSYKGELQEQWRGGASGLPAQYIYIYIYTLRFLINVFLIHRFFTWFQEIKFPASFLYHIIFSCFFFEKADLIWPLRPIPHVEKTRKWILSLWPSTLKRGIWIVFTSRSSMFMKSGFPCWGFNKSILLAQGGSRIVTSSKYDCYMFQLDVPWRSMASGMPTS